MDKVVNGNGISSKKWIFFPILAAIILAGGAVTIIFFTRGSQEDERAVAIIPIGVETAATLGEEYAVFKHPQIGFSVEYPKELVIEGYKEKDGGETLVFRQQEVPKNVLEKVGFQIYNVPFGEPVISRERILKDIPNKKIFDLQTVTINPAAATPQQGLLFWSEAPEIGKTREVWFVRDGYLYAITAYAHLDLWLAKILSTWRFEK